MPLWFVEEKVLIMSSNGMVPTISSVMKKTSENVNIRQVNYFEANLFSNMGLAVRASALLYHFFQNNFGQLFSIKDTCSNVTT